jgi:aminopeptidase N
MREKRNSIARVLCLLLSVGPTIARCQVEPKAPPVFTHADTLRGMLTPERTCYDVRYYHLDVRIDPAQQSISGSNTIRFTVDSAFDRMQLDLFANMKIGGIALDGKGEIPFDRDSNAFFLKLPAPLEKGTEHRVVVNYSGKPIAAKNPPWQGGFTWKTDSAGNPWVVVTCQGTGASCWWPNKDHQADEPDSMSISVTVPPGLEDVSNGRLRAKSTLPDGWTRYDWFVSYPINNYNVTVNIGKFAHFSDLYKSDGGPLTLDYYVMPYHLGQAQAQFEQVKPMLKAYERYFGPYPFVRDGYKLIESPHNGMEHQSAVAYGNRYLGGYVGRSSSEVGMKFDFIIVHESAHEWWGNSVTSKDVADMWLHESFGAYSEALFVEDRFGREQSLRYINAKKQNVRNDAPIVGVYNVQREGSGDMYDKGQLVLNTIRSVIDDDNLWFSILRGIQETYRYQTITYDTVVQYVNRRCGKDLTYLFDQYLKFPKPPRLEVIARKKGSTVTARLRWVAEVPAFRMPIKATVNGKGFEWISPTTAWQTMTLKIDRPEDFRIADDLFYVELKLNSGYWDPRLGE